MDDVTCPKCKTTKYRNPSMRLMVNVCGHGLCESCVELLFVKGSGSCPECNIPLRRTNFRIQLFEDASIDKEVEIRRRVLRDYCKTQNDFGSLRDYNDYLEMVEDIIFNLSNNVNVVETNRLIAEYKEANKEFLSKHKHRSIISQERLELEDIIAEERSVEAKRKLEDARIEAAVKISKVRDKEKLIDDLMFSEGDAKAIVEEHKVLRGTQVSNASELLAANRTALNIGGLVEEGLPYVYEEISQEFDGPSPPISEAEVNRQKYDVHIRPADESEKAAGYQESMAALRALQEAMSGLYFRCDA